MPSCGRFMNYIHKLNSTTFDISIASVGNTQNVASSLTTTAGNFFRKYTSPSSTTNIEMGQLGNKTVSTYHSLECSYPLCLPKRLVRTGSWYN